MSVSPVATRRRPVLARLGVVGAMGLWVLVGAGACRQVPLYGHPGIVSSEPSPPPPSQLFEIEWQTRLVPHRTWEYEPREMAAPALNPDTGQLIVLTRDGVIRAVSPEGKVDWEYQTFGPFSAAARVIDGMVFAAGGDGVLYALVAKSGELRWKIDLGEELGTTPVLSTDRVLVASHAGTVFAVTAADGQRAWQYRRDLPPGFNIRGVSTPVLGDGLAYVGFADGYVAALDVNDGTARWERAISGDGTEFLDVDATPVLDSSGRLFVASYKSGVFALDPATGAEKWRADVSGITSLLGRGSVIFGTGDTRVTAWHSETGRELWSLSLKERAGLSPVFAQGYLVVPVGASLLFVDPTAGRTRLAWDPGMGVSAPPLVSRSRMFVLSNNGYLYSMRLGGGG